MPIYKPGDHVLIFNWGGFYAGDVVVFKKGGKNLIKRITKTSDGQIYVRGDNKVKSVVVDPIKQEDVVGKVIFKY